MSQDSNVTYEVVRRACAELLGRGEKPSRPSVQALLVRDDYLGHKGSNAVVQKLINGFWSEVGDRLKAPPRIVADVPEPYVATIDKALADMVTISRQIADEEMATREAALTERQTEMQAQVQAARDLAAAADQSRLRAEGERNALEARLREQAAELAQSRKDVQAGQEREARLTADVRERDTQIKHLDAAVVAAKEAAAAAQAQHEAEVRRLLVQVDEARQNAIREAAAVKALNARVNTLDQELATARAQLDASAGQITALRKGINEKAAKITEQEGQLSAKDAELSALNRKLLTIEVQVDAANQQRTVAEGRLAAQTEELGRLRGQIEALEKIQNNAAASSQIARSD